MNCRTVQQKLSAYIDGELNGREMLFLRSHVLQCPSCAMEEEEIRRLKGILSGAPQVEPPPGFEERLMASLVEGKRRQIQRSLGVPILGLFALGSAGLTLMVLRITDHHSSSQPLQVIHPTHQATDVSYGVRLDQAGELNHDPLSGGNVIFVTNERR